MNLMKEGEKMVGTRRSHGWGGKGGLLSCCGFSAWADGCCVLVGCYMVPLCELEKSAHLREWGMDGLARK